MATKKAYLTKFYHVETLIDRIDDAVADGTLDVTVAQWGTVLEVLFPELYVGPPVVVDRASLRDTDAVLSDGRRAVEVHDGLMVEGNGTIDRPGECTRWLEPREPRSGTSHYAGWRSGDPVPGGDV